MIKNNYEVIFVKKRILAALMSASMIIGTMPTAFAASDITGHWSEKYIKYLNEQGVINPSAQTGNYTPDATISRAEFIRYINRAFHFTEKAEINYTDVKDDAWYYPEIQIAEKYGYINGVGNNKMDPDGDVTREQAATIIGRLYKTTTADAVTPSQLSFTDKNKISTWSAGYIYEAVKKGYITGYPEGDFKPQNTIRRSEIAKILYSYLGNSLSEEGAEYTGADFRNDVENVTISESCTLSNAEVGGDLYITEGLGSDKVTLKNVSMTGTLIISGGNVTLENVDAPTIIIGSSMNRLVEVTATGNTNVSLTQIQSTASIKESALNVSAGGFSDASISGGSSTSVTIDGKLWTLDVLSNTSVTLSTTSEINTLNMKAAGNVGGYGKINQANISANGSNFSITPNSYKLSGGISATINGNVVKSETAVSITPDKLTWDKGTQQTQDYFEFTLSQDPKTLEKIELEGKILTVGTDYRTTEKGIRLYSTFLKSISTEGNYVLDLTFSGGAKAKLNITISDSYKNTVTPTSAVFDKNPASANNGSIYFTIASAKGVLLNNITVSGKTLTMGNDYVYQSSTGVVELKSSYLNSKSIGTLNITFNMSKNNAVTAQITIKDSTPVNSLSSTQVDFDANEQSTEYGDVSVKLNAVNNAVLKRIVAVGTDKVLDEGWHYTISSSGDILINKSALASLASDSRSYIDLRFEMSEGVNPVLRVNYVTTYAVRVSITDDLGSAVKNASVNIAPQDSTDDTASKAQEKISDSSGIATFYVKKGNYTITVSGTNFEKVTKNVNISYAQSVNMNVALEETIKIAVTESSGAYISGAVVTLDNKTVTTGADGMASFTVKRGVHTLTVTANGYSTYSNRNFEVTSSITQRVKMSR